MILFSRLLTFLFLQAISSNWFFPAYASTLRCPDIPITFEQGREGDIKCACETAMATIIFLKKIGLKSSDIVTIRLVDHIPSHQMHSLMGCFDTASQKVELLTYSKAIKLSKGDKSMFGIDISEDIWCSYAAHEIAHAVSSQYISPEIENHTAGEYISAVAQLTVLTPESREMILKKYQEIEAYKSRAEISSLYFLMAPNEFAVKCYLHFISLDKPKEFIERLINENGEFGESY